MKLYEEWSKQLEGLQTQDQYNKFWGDYLPKEKGLLYQNPKREKAGPGRHNRVFGR